MPAGYGSHHDYMEWVREGAEARQEAVELALRRAFSEFIDRKQVEIVVFNSMSALDLADAIREQPLVLKPLLAACNVAARAIERDLGIKNVDTYTPRLTNEQAQVIAGYLKPFLPPYLEIPALVQLDRVAYIDKEIRKAKGRWERKIVEALNRHAAVRFRKRTFEAGGETFELDAASPEEGPIKLGIDIKRIEARRDIHKRSDEIANKAAQLKSACSGARFGAVVYYPFIDEHINVQNRLRSSEVDAVVFASQADDSIESAVRMLLTMLNVATK